MQPSAWVLVFGASLASLMLTGCAMTQRDPDQTARLLSSTWAFYDTGTTASLRGICGVDGRVAWAGGSGGTVLRTTSGGRQWENVSIPDAESLDFRSIHAFDANAAVVLSAGSPARLYRTTDGGKHWSLVFEDTRPEIFFDGMRFDGQGFGMAFGDPIDGQLQLITSVDRGATWRVSEGAHVPAVSDGEAGFAASNSGLAMNGTLILIGLGGESPSGRARVARSEDAGRTWQVVETPLAASQSAGVFSIALLDRKHAVAVGGDYLQPERAEEHWAITSDGGKTWREASAQGPRGYSSCAAGFRGLGDDLVVAVGPYGLDVSADGGKRWIGSDDTPWHALSATPDGDVLWMSGSDGRVGVVRFD